MNKQWKRKLSIVANNFFAIGLLLVVVVCGNTQATSVLQMNLTQLTDRAEQIFSGTVLSVAADSIAAGGGQIPVLRYKVRVDDQFKGQFREEKGVLFAEFAMIGTMAQLKSQQESLLPMLQQGKQYLLMVAPSGPLGITSTVGLSQGTFNLSLDANKEMMAVNGADNVGLFTGMNVNTSQTIAARANGANTITNQSRGPVAYSQLADMIRQAMEAR